METEISRHMWADLKSVQPTIPGDPTDTGYGPGMTNPVQNLTWYEAVLFANLLSAQRGLTQCYYVDASFSLPLDASNYTVGPFYCDWDAEGYRLPSEGEWEYFCRAGTTTPFWILEPNYTSADCDWTSAPGMYPSLETAAWFWGNCVSLYPLPSVGTKTANPLGLRDVHGNVWEWCWDWYLTDYPTFPVTDYQGPETGSLRMRRGGSWSSFALSCRSACRGQMSPGNRYYLVGFRLVRTAR